VDGTHGLRRFVTGRGRKARVQCPLMRAALRMRFSRSPRKNRVGIVGALSALEVGDARTIVLADWMGRLGQDLFYPPNVGGWPGGRGWLGSRGLIARVNFAAGLDRPGRGRQPVRRSGLPRLGDAAGRVTRAPLDPHEHRSSGGFHTSHNHRSETGGRRVVIDKHPTCTFCSRRHGPCTIMGIPLPVHSPEP
jgi:Protein of unknown function (DUF1800)